MSDQTQTPELSEGKSQSTEASVARPRTASRRIRRRRIWPWLTLLAIAFCLWQKDTLWPPLFHRLATQKLDRHEPEEALKWLDRAEWFGAERPDTAMLRTRAARLTGDVALFAQALQLSESRDVSSIYLQRERILSAAQSGQMSIATPHLSTLLTDTSGDNRDVCLAYVTGFLRSLRLNEAMSLLDVLLKDSPNDAYPWLIRGRIWLLQSESRKAESDFRMALSIRPDWNEPLIYLAETLYDTRRASEALPLFENAMKSDEFRTRAAVGLARCMKAIAEVDKAKAVLQDALKQDPLNHDALMELGRTYQEEGEVNLAIPLLESAIRQMPGSEESHYRLAQCYLSVGRKDEADREFKIVDEARLALSELNRLNDQIRNQPQNEDLLVRSGELMLRFADPDDGVAVLMSALDINPSNKTAHKLLAEHYQKLSATIPELRQQFERHKKLSE